jgi:hypothetical protein
MTDRLKEFIFKKLSEDLSHAEVILHRGNIWFIDRENKYWYFEFQESGRLFWRWGFFDNFFKLFDIGYKEYEPLITEWFELFLHGKVEATQNLPLPHVVLLESVLRNGVKKTMDCGTGMYSQIDLILGNITPRQKSDNNHNVMVRMFG